MSSFCPQTQLDGATYRFVVHYSTWIYRPMSPILTTRAIRETPKPGSNVAIKSIPKSQSEMLKSFKRVDPEVMEDSPWVQLEDAL